MIAQSSYVAPVEMTSKENFNDALAYNDEIVLQLYLGIGISFKITFYVLINQ